MNRLDLKNSVNMKIALNIADLSHCKRYKVGAYIVDNSNRPISLGYNGNPSGTDDICEIDNVTKPTVIHAELNAILNAKISDMSDCKIYITLSPCLHCAAVILQKKIKEVYYYQEYRDLSGVEYLRQHGVKVEKITI